MGKHSGPEVSPGPSRVGSLLSWVAVMAAAVAIGLAVRTFVVEFFEVPSASMVPTIEEGDRLVCVKVGRGDAGFAQAGDVVMFDDPSGSGNVLVKRVIATGGQTVDLVGGQVLVDGVALEEPYVMGLPTEPLATQMPGVELSYPLTVPEGCLWVMGDNRTNSRDSRYFGPVSADALVGRAVWTYWPPSSWGALE